ncbi:MAG TPA: NlpC/P60 family protein [Mycobacteriales bacterium]|jgi:cell wall-associated NlpC family hydrolase|nr:NlpC/P60 family protein [Mycobacteriales bacterium]
MAAVAASTALIVVTVPGAAHAAPAKTTGHDSSKSLKKPTTSAEAEKQLGAMNQRLEIITEQYNGANIDLAKRKHEAATAHADVSRLNRNIHTLQGKVKKVAVSAYQNGHLASFSSFLSSKSPQSFLDQLSTLDVIAKKQTSTLDGLSAAQKGAEKASAEANKAEAQAKATTIRLKTQKRTILTQVHQLNTLMHGLSAKELQAYRDAQGSIDKQAVERQVQQEQQQGDNQPPTNQPSSNPSQDPGPGSKASGKAAIAVKAAEAELGKPYVWAAAGPDSFDCSGLLVWAWGKAGVSLPHQSAEQYAMGTHVSESDLQPGDLVAYYSPIHHIAMYVGNGMVIQAPQTGDVVKYSPVNSMPYTGATRVG